MSVNAVETCSVLCHRRAMETVKLQNTQRVRKKEVENQGRATVKTEVEKTSSPGQRDQGPRLNFGELCRVVHFG